MKKTRVYIDLFYHKTALSGIKTYIEELVIASKTFGREDVEYIFSHDITTEINNHLFINSKFRLIRWVFQLRYIIWKQVVLPIKLLTNNADYVICPDYVAPIFCSSKKIVVIHDNLLWKYPKNYPNIWRKYYIKLISLGINVSSTIVTTSKYSKSGLESIFPNNKICPIYQSSETLSISQSYESVKKYILHIGTFEKRKDLITLIKAFRKLKNYKNIDYKLVLAGSTYINGDNKVFLEIQNYLERNNLFNSVLMPGYIDKNKASYFFPIH